MATADSVKGCSASQVSDFPFPLALAPFEHYMLADDHPDYPMTVAIRLRFTGRIDRTRFQDALQRALHFHPLLRACVCGSTDSRTSRITWIASAKAASVTWFEPDDECLIPRCIDLHRDPGLRISVRDDEKAPCMMIQWHHACCDGAGILHFIETLLLAYRDGSTFAQPTLEACLHSRQWWRDRKSLGTRWYDHARRSPHDLARVYRYFRNPTTGLAGGQASISASSDHLLLDDGQAFTFSLQDTKQLMAAARHAGVSLNDLLLSIYFDAISQWNAQHQVGSARQNLRVAVPINLRSADAPLAPAVNGVSMVFIDRTPAQIQNASGLLSGIAREMRNVKRWQTGWALLRILSLAGRLRGGMVRLIEGSGPMISSGLSNLGRVFVSSELTDSEGKVRASMLVLEGVEPFPPVRPGVLAAVDVLTYANQLTVTINHDRRKLPHEAAGQLLQQYVSLLHNRAQPEGQRHDLD